MASAVFADRVCLSEGFFRRHLLFAGAAAGRLARESPPNNYNQPPYSRATHLRRTFHDERFRQEQGWGGVDICTLLHLEGDVRANHMTYQCRMQGGDGLIYHTRNTSLLHALIAHSGGVAFAAIAEFLDRADLVRLGRTKCCWLSLSLSLCPNKSALSGIADPDLYKWIQSHQASVFARARAL